MQPCPICLMPLASDPRVDHGNTEFDCHNCGTFTLAGPTETELGHARLDRKQRATVSYGIRRLREKVSITPALLQELESKTQLPDAASLIDNLLVHLSRELPAPGETLDLWAPALRASIGALTSRSVQWVLEQVTRDGLVEGQFSRALGGADSCRLVQSSLTIGGWNRVRELTIEGRDSHTAFMAMKFGDAELDSVFQEVFKSAVRQTGFDLTRLDESPQAGLIDDRLRLSIRTSRFVIADLTHANNGAYWEAGYAEGLGRPVIYTCRKDVFEDAKRRPHFDTNHHLTVVWDPGALHKAHDELKSVIRVTLPAEAILRD